MDQVTKKYRLRQGTPGTVTGRAAMNEKKKVNPAKQATRQYVKLWADLTDSPVLRNTPQRTMAVVWAS
jgi:hypothetical protein